MTPLDDTVGNNPGDGKEVSTVLSPTPSQAAAGELPTVNPYYSRKISADEMERGFHRDFVGGKWDELGKLQFDFLLSQGLTPDMRLIDIGCGALRAGVHFIKYLNPGNYYGIDANGSLLEAGYEIELAKAGLQKLIPRERLMEDRSFRVSTFGTLFDYGIAASVFTHVMLNHIRVCLIEVSKAMKQGGKFFATYFDCPIDTPIEFEMKHASGFLTFPEKDPYHYRFEDFKYLASNLPLEAHYIGEWGHKHQKMICFVKL
jgi:SAM-dependent methyltransferase